MAGIEYYENNPSWNPSLGQDITKIHFRNGHHHAVCDSNTNKCSEHYDKYDPHESVPDLFKHLATNKYVQTGVASAITGVIVGAWLAYRISKK